MNSRQRATLKWRQKKLQSYANNEEAIKRTVKGIVYQYPSTMDSQFQTWAAKQRINQQEYFFDSFYKQLPEDLKPFVIVTPPSEVATI